MEDLKTTPIPTLETKPYWDACQQEKLTIQQCSDCGHVSFILGLCVPNVVVETFHGFQ